ncbi:MAG: RNA-guided endonuclease IscB [Giesbergeria sp.]|uniref:RNA-guided endonuclease IscB n=1 Tax=Giesbergeria sp. TaxID=2818473 RepID=UPI0026185E0F|nr:RNA-guided endonuclease IscB [Giesbergeria sp.]MDD2609422.1 RNA-guided endonuclease IscB [Giesbergeria sp.]
MSVFVLDRSGRPLMPCTEKRARLLLERGRARVHRLIPFVIRLVDRQTEDCDFQPLRIKINPGSKTTGMALVREQGDTVVVLNLMELVHRSHKISETLTSRSQMRRRRRSANLRHRAPRFLNRRNKKPGWLAPSLQHRVNSTQAWVKKLRRYAPVAAISTQLVRFDTQKLQNPEISGIEYQQGTLAGYEAREYLLEKWNRTCAYCGAKNVPLQVEHIHPKSKGGSNRISNLCLACGPCNQKKNAQDVRDFVKDPAKLARILAQAKAPLKDAAAVNSTRWALTQALQATGLTVETGTGGLTKFNRTRLEIPKTHALDAVCVGEIGMVQDWNRPTLQIRCTGRGSYQRTRLTAQGFPRGYLMRQKQVHGFQTGDMVKAVVPCGKKAGTHWGRVAVRASGSFNIQTPEGAVQGISHRYCKLVQRNDGYGYSQVAKMDVTGTPPKQGTLRVPRSTSPA